MSDCCAKHVPTSVLVCPECGVSGKTVGMKTVWQQVKFPFVLDIVENSYYYCADKNCSVGYFSLAADIPQSQLRASSDIANDKLCYCFDINGADYERALTAGTAPSIKQFVIQKTQSGDCACAIRNPSGQCCLAHFKRLEKSFATS